MAWTIINGEVTKVGESKPGVNPWVKIKETFKKRDGSDGQAFYTAWFDADPGLSIGDTGKFSGPSSVAAEEYEGKWHGRLSLNSTKFEPSEAVAKPF